MRRILRREDLPRPCLPPSIRALATLATRNPAARLLTVELLLRLDTRFSSIKVMDTRSRRTHKRMAIAVLLR